MTRGSRKPEISPGSHSQDRAQAKIAGKIGRTRDQAAQRRGRQTAQRPAPLGRHVIESRAVARKKDQEQKTRANNDSQTDRRPRNKAVRINNCGRPSNSRYQ